MLHQPTPPHPRISDTDSDSSNIHPPPPPQKKGGEGGSNNS